MGRGEVKPLGDFADATFTFGQKLCWGNAKRSVLFVTFVVSSMGRILAIDYGRKRVGLAVTDPLQLIATPLATVPAHEVVEFLQRYVAENEVERFVVGEPRQMNGEPSESQRYITPFVNRLRKVLPEIPVVFYDERFTSVLAHRAIIEGGVKKMTRQTDKGLVDRVSAVIILQSYLESEAVRSARG